MRWIRIASLGAPFVLVTAAAQGWMRALQDTRTPLVVIGLANVASIALSAGLVFGARTRDPRVGDRERHRPGGVRPALPRHPRPPARVAPAFVHRIRVQFAAARDLTVRTAAFFVTFTVAASVAARIGNTTLAAHQIGAQIWTFCALFLDSTAIAAQALIGRLLGAGQVDAALALGAPAARAGALLGVASGSCSGSATSSCRASSPPTPA